MTPEQAAARYAAAAELARAYDSAVQHFRYAGPLTKQHQLRIQEAEARYDAARRQQ